MKKFIFTITTQHDGLMNVGFSNIKALHNYLANTMSIGNSHMVIGGNQRILFNYKNLTFVIRANQKDNRFFVAHIYSDHYDTITINDLGILSK